MGYISLRGLLLKNTAVQMIAQAVSSVIGLATSVVLSRYLGVEGFGQFNYIFAFSYFFIAMNDFGVNTVVVREVSKQPERGGEIIGAMLSFKVCVAIIGILAAWTVIPLMKFPEGLRNALFLFVLILPVMALQLPAVIFQVLLKAEYPAIIGIFNRCAGFLLMIGMVWMGYGLTAIVSALLLAEFATLLITLKCIRRFVRPAWRFDPGLWKEVLRSSGPLGIAGLLVALINRVDFIMLERMTNLREVGLYAAAYKVTSVLEAFPAMIMGTLYPLMSRYASEDVERLRALYRKSVSYLSLVALPMGIGITVCAPVIVRLLFGANFMGAERGLTVLVWSTVFLYVAISGGNLLISVGKEKVNLLILAVGALTNIGLNLLWIPTLGFVGAALSTAITFLVILVGTTIGVRIYLDQERQHEAGGILASFQVELGGRKSKLGSSSTAGSVKLHE